MQEFQFQALDEGVYIQQNWNLFFVSINELKIEKKNYNFLIFSTGTKKVEFLVELLDKMDGSFEEDIISYAYFYYYEDLKMAAETKNIKVDKLSINIKKAIDRIGLKRVIE